MKTLSDNVKGMLLMSLSMAGFTLADANLKMASEYVSTGVITLALGLGGTILFWIMLARKGEPLFSSAIFEPPVMLRSVGETVATVFMVMALTYSSFIAVTVIVQTLPLLLTLFSLIFLGEKVGIQRLSAVLLGFCGMLIIMRPGTDGFDIFSLFAVLAVMGMAMRDIGSRLAAKHHSSVRLAIFGTMAQTIAGIVFMLFEPAPSWPPMIAWVYLFGMISLASFAIILVTKAMRIGEVSAVSPFRYTRLLFVILAGVIIFGDSLDNFTILGSVIILLAGLYIWQREQRLAAKK